jgi:hypothetical protein
MREEQIIQRAVQKCISAQMTEEEYKYSIDVAATVKWLAAYLPDHANFIKRASSEIKLEDVIAVACGSMDNFKKMSGNKQRKIVKAIQVEKKTILVFVTTLLNIVQRLDTQIDEINSEVIDNRVSEFSIPS